MTVNNFEFISGMFFIQYELIWLFKQLKFLFSSLIGIELVKFVYFIFLGPTVGMNFENI